VIQLADVTAGIGGFATDGEKGDDRAGASVSMAGDINGDGLDDVVVGAPHADPNGYGSGRAYVVLGKADTDRVLLSHVAQGTGGFAMDGEEGHGFAGGSVSGVGDVNGDGVADVVVGSGFGGYVVFGKPDTEPVQLADVAAGIGGFVMGAGGASGAGDVNGDGLTDLIAAATYKPDPEGIGARIRNWVVFGKADTEPVTFEDIEQGIGGFYLHEAEHEATYPQQAVNGVGDFDGDGLSDVVMASFNASGYAGRAYVVFGKTDTEAVSLVEVGQGTGGFALDGENADDYFGGSVSGAGDVNGDGLADFVAGAAHADPSGRDSGRAYVVFGTEGPVNVTLADVAQGIGGFVMDGEAVDHKAGGSVSGAGDVNGDGLADLIVGAPYVDWLSNDPGRAYVVFGKADTGPVSLADVAQGIGGFVMVGEAIADLAGSSVSGAGDVNGDGIPDLIVGAWRADPNGSDSGRTYVVFGGDFSCEGG
jgi:hypothetical protein